METAVAKIFIEDTIANSYFRLAKVNLITGEYIFVKGGRRVTDPDIYTYMKKTAMNVNFSYGRAKEYEKFFDPDYVRKRVFYGEKRITFSYRENLHSNWVTFAVIVPEGCCEENPWVAFGWREADIDTILMVDSLSALYSIYHKILRINITNDTFRVIKYNDAAEEAVCGRAESITEWWRLFGENGFVHTDDLDEYRSFTDIERLREYFASNDARLSCRYRRKSGDEYRWAQMDIVKGTEYSNDDQVLLLYVKDIHDEQLKEMDRRRQLLDQYSRDALTFLYNRHKFREDMEQAQRENNERFTCLYVDVNGLHELNNSLGHKKGDDMLCTVADTLRRHFYGERVYRIGGDEFVMLSKLLSKESVERAMEKVRSELMEDNYAVSAGVESSSGDVSVYRTVGAAELAMRADKERYYKNNDTGAKKRTMNEELEKMLAHKQDEESFIAAISARFAGVYLVDLEKDEPRHIYIPSYFARFLENTDYCYSAAMRMYLEQYVDKAYQERFNEVLDYGRLKKMLKNKKETEFIYTKVDNTSMKLRIMKISDTSENCFDTMWIFTYE